MFKWKDLIISILLVFCISCSVTAAAKTGVITIEGPRGEQGIQGEQGERGEKGDTGLSGVQGAPGEKGDNGKDGVDGKDGRDGKDGLTPYIGEDGNWYIGTEDTGVAATTTLWETVVETNWSTCNTGDIIAFMFQPYYVASQERELFVYSYQQDSSGIRYSIHTTSYNIGSTIFTPPKNGADDKLVYLTSCTYACIGKVIYKSSVQSIFIEIIEAVKT